MNAAFSEIQDGAFSHLPLLQFLYEQGLVKGVGCLGRGHGRKQIDSGLGRAHVDSLWKLRSRRPYFCPDGHATRGGAAWGQEGWRSSGWGGGKELHAKAKMWVFRAQLGMDLTSPETQ